MQMQKDFLLVVMIAVCPITVRGAEQQPKLNAFEAGAIGAAVGAAESVTGLPCNFIKNRAQLKVPFQRVVAKIATNPIVLWRGAGTNTAFMAPITLAQFVVNNELGQLAGGTPSMMQGVAIAALAGAVPALFSAPAERTMLFQQETGEGLISTMKQLVKTDGMRAVVRGLPATMVRDAGFCAGLLALMPFLKKQIEEKSRSPVIATASAAVIAGTVTTCATHWVDTVKTYQFAVRGHQGKNMIEALREICHEGGVKALHSGIVARNARIAFALATMDTAKNWLTKFYLRNEA